MQLILIASSAIHCFKQFCRRLHHLLELLAADVLLKTYA